MEARTVQLGPAAEGVAPDLGRVPKELVLLLDEVRERLRRRECTDRLFDQAVTYAIELQAVDPPAYAWARDADGAPKPIEGDPCVTRV